MAYEGGGFSALWKPDLTTRAGAQSAMNSAKFGFLIVGTFKIFTNFFTIMAGVAEAPDNGLLYAAAALAVLDVALPFAAAWRLGIGKGAFVAPVATIFYILGLIGAFNIFSLVIGGIFVAVFISGIRGSWALRRGTGFEEDVYDTFG